MLRTCVARSKFQCTENPLWVALPLFVVITIPVLAFTACLMQSQRDWVMPLNTCCFHALIVFLPDELRIAHLSRNAKNTRKPFACHQVLVTAAGKRKKAGKPQRGDTKILGLRRLAIQDASCSWFFFNSARTFRHAHRAGKNKIAAQSSRLGPDESRNRPTSINPSTTVL